MTEPMAIAIVLPGFNGLGRSLIPTFPSRNRFYLQLSPRCPKMNKNQFGKLKKIQVFCSRGIANPALINYYIYRGSHISLSWFSCGSSILVELGFGVFLWREENLPSLPSRGCKARDIVAAKCELVF